MEKEINVHKLKWVKNKAIVDDRYQIWLDKPDRVWVAYILDLDGNKLEWSTTLANDGFYWGTKVEFLKHLNSIVNYKVFHEVLNDELKGIDGHWSYLSYIIDLGS